MPITAPAVLFQGLVTGVMTPAVLYQGLVTGYITPAEVSCRFFFFKSENQRQNVQAFQCISSCVEWALSAWLVWENEQIICLKFITRIKSAWI